MLRRTLLALALIVSLAAPAHSAPSETDQKYTQDISSTLIEFQDAISAWGSIASDQPAKTTSPKYKSWKTKFAKSSNAVLTAITKLDSISAPMTFTKSDSLLHESMGNYRKGITQLKSAVDKNSSKAISSANKTLASANKSFTSWQAAYLEDVKALNG